MACETCYSSIIAQNPMLAVLTQLPRVYQRHDH